MRTKLVHLTAGVLSPDVKHKHAGDKSKRHDKDWNWSTVEKGEGKQRRNIRKVVDMR